MSSTILGLDIRYDLVSAVLVKTSLRSSLLTGFAQAPLSAKDDDQSGLRSALAIIAKKIDISDVICITSLPAEWISFRNLKVPFQDEKKIKQILPFELESSMAQPVDSLAFDFQVLTTGEQTEILAASIEKSRLENFLAILESAHIKPEIVTIGGLPAVLSLIKKPEFLPKALLIDTDNEKNALFVINNNQLYLVRIFPRNVAGHDPLELLCINIEQTLTAINQKQDADFFPQAVYLTGHGIKTKRAIQKMAEILKLAVQNVDPVYDSQIAKDIQDDQGWFPDLMYNAYALAALEISDTRCINFCQRRSVINKHWTEYRSSMIGCSLLFLLMICAFLSNILFDSYLLKKELTTLDNNIKAVFSATFPDVKRIVDPLQQMRVKLKEAQQDMAGSSESQEQIKIIDILNNISQLIPGKTDFEITRFLVGAEIVTISGSTDTFNGVDEIKSRLAKDELFQKVTISSANQEKTGKRIRFKLKIQL